MLGWSIGEASVNNQQDPEEIMPALGRSLRFQTDRQPDLGTQAKRYSDLRTSKVTGKVA
jgi:hypothetical protein